MRERGAGVMFKLDWRIADWLDTNFIAGLSGNASLNAFARMLVQQQHDGRHRGCPRQRGGERVRGSAIWSCLMMEGGNRWRAFTGGADRVSIRASGSRIIR